MLHDRMTRGSRGLASQVSDLFLEWDIDNDGNVSKEEFCKSLANLGIVVKPAQLDMWFESFDKDNNGNIR